MIPLLLTFRGITQVWNSQRPMLPKARVSEKTGLWIQRNLFVTTNTTAWAAKLRHKHYRQDKTGSVETFI